MRSIITSLCILLCGILKDISQARPHIAERQLRVHEDCLHGRRR